MTIRGAIVIAVLGVIIYANSLGGEFQWDDGPLIVENELAKDPSNTPSLFTKENVRTASGKTYHFYRPLQIITYIFDYSVWGESPRGYHITNMILHILAALAVYWFASLIFKNGLFAFFTGLLFLVHPIHTEAVAYISGRADPLAMIFMMLALVFYIKNNLIAGAFYAVALLSRENALILPFLILLYHYSFRVKIKAKLFLPIVGVSIAYIIMRLTILKHLLTIAQVGTETTFLERLPGVFVAIAAYIKILFFPVDLHMEYGNALFTFANPAAILGLAITIILLGIAFVKRKTMVSFAILWFFIALLPMSNLYPISAYMAEHWLYVPSVGFFIIIAYALNLLYEKVIHKSRGGLSLPYFCVVGSAIALVAFWSYLTIEQNKYWRALIPFYERTLKYAPESKRINNDYALALQSEKRYDEAEAVYEKLIKLYPDATDVYVNLSSLSVKTGRYEKAVALCKKAIELEPVNATAYNNLSVAYYALGHYKEAVYYCKQAIHYGYRVNPKLLELLKPYWE